jgi:hypothetical protein
MSGDIQVSSPAGGVQKRFVLRIPSGVQPEGAHCTCRLLAQRQRRPADSVLLL